MRTLFLILLIACGLAACTEPPSGGDPIVTYAEDDPELIAATRQAEQSLTPFLNYIEANPAKVADAALKVGLPMVGVYGEEHIWITPFAQVGPDQFTGFLANNPNNLGPLQLGDPVAFTRDQISDWNVLIGGREYGSFTTRALLPRIPEEEAARLQQILSEEPLPPGWR